MRPIILPHIPLLSRATLSSIPSLLHIGICDARLPPRGRREVGPSGVASQGAQGGPQGLLLQPEFVTFTVRWLAGGSGRHGRGPGGGGARPTSATDGRGRRQAGRPRRRTGAGPRCRSTGSAPTVVGGGRARWPRPRPGTRRPAWPGSPSGTRSASGAPGAGQPQGDLIGSLLATVVGRGALRHEAWGGALLRVA
jgi:hypothetical protein